MKAAPARHGEGHNESKGFTMNDINRYDGAQSPFDAIRRTRPDGTEYWSARDLQPVMGYSTWRNFLVPIERARTAAGNQGEDTTTHFAGSRKVSASGPDSEDVHLTRFGAYLVAMNGDPNKPEVAAAQAYFAIRTREAETRPVAPVLHGPELVALALVEATQMLEDLKAERERDRPAVEYVNTHVLVDDDVMLIEDWGRTYGLTRPQAFELLRDQKDLIYAKKFERWSPSKGRKVVEVEYRPRAGKPSFTWFDVKEQRDAPRRNNGQARKTCYIKAVHAVDLARLTGLLPKMEVAS